MASKIERQFNYLETMKLLGAFKEHFFALFGKGYRAKSFWEWVDNVNEEFGDFKIEDSSHDVDTAFFFSVLKFIDFDLLSKTKLKMDRANALLENIQAIQGAISGEEGTQWQELGDMFKKLDISDAGIDFFRKKFSGIKIEDLKQVMNEVLPAYNECKTMFGPFASVFLCNKPNGTPATLNEWSDLMLKFNVETKEVKDYPPILRYLGQSVFSHDPEMELEANRILVDLFVSAKILSDRNEILILICFIYLAFERFDLMLFTEQKVLFNGFAWWAVYFGFPLETILKRVLADQPLLPYYLERSMAFSDSLLNSEEEIYFDEEKKFPFISLFISGFSDFSKGKDFDVNTQKNYVESFVEKHGLPVELKDDLAKFLLLYLHLRECDLIDYRGLLSDEGAAPGQDWLNLLRSDITEEKSAEIREYFQLLHRPTRMRIELITSFEKIKWYEEPFIGRILILNNIYEDVYPFFGSLVYFDESETKWKLNKDLPEPWKIWPDFQPPVKKAETTN